MSIIEFQVSSSAFLAAQLDALRARPLCHPKPFIVGATQILVDNIEFGGNSLRHDVDASFPFFFSAETLAGPGIDLEGLQTQIAQEVTVYLTTYDEIAQHPNAPPGMLFPLRGTLLFNVDFYALDDECYLTTRLVDLKPALLDPLPAGLPVDVTELLQQATQYLLSLIPSPAIPAGLSPLAKLWAKFVNAGVSVDQSLQRIAFRAQIGGFNDSALQPWKDFYNGFFADRLGGADWAAYIDAGLITEWVKAQVNSFVDPIDVDHLQLFVGCNYSDAGGNATFTLDVEAVYGLPDPLPTISADPRVVTTLSVDGLNTLKLSVDYSNVVNLIHSVGIVEFFLPSLSNALEGLLQAAIRLELADLAKNDSAPYCQKTGRAQIECKKLIRMPQIGSGIDASLSQLLAFDTGISFVGTLHSAMLTPATLFTDFGKFAWVPPSISCGQSSRTTVEDFRQNAADRSRLRAEVRLTQSGTTPVYICSSPVVFDDPLGKYPAAAITVDQTRLPATYVITIVPPGPAYGLDLLVSTTAGMRLIRIPPPPPLTQQIIDFLAETIRVQLAICDKAVSPWFHGERVFNAAWIVDPLVDPDPTATVDHLWNVEIEGLREADRVIARTGSGEQITAAMARSGMPLRFSSLIPPGSAHDMSILLDRGAPAMAKALEARAPASPGVDLRRQPVYRTRTINLPGVCRKLTNYPRLGTQGIAAILADRIIAFNLTNPYSPLLVGTWSFSGLRGACRFGSALLAFGTEGFAAMDGAPDPSPLGPRCEPRRIADAVAAGRVVYVLTEDSLEVRSTSLCILAAFPVHGGRTLLRVGLSLFVGGRAGLAVYDISDACKPARIAATDQIEITELAVSPDGPPGAIAAVSPDGTARSFQLLEGKLLETAVHPRAPWFMRSLCVSRMLITLQDDSQAIGIALLGASRLVVPADPRM